MHGIVAMDNAGGIGLNGQLPWPHNKHDLAFFKKMTLNQKVVVGNNTRKKLPPLPNRTIFTLSRNYNFRTENNPGGHLAAFYFTDEKGNHFNEHFIKNIEQAGYGDDVWLIGGASIYKQFIPDCGDLYITHITGEFKADTIFPFTQDQINKIFPCVYKIAEFPGGQIIKYSKKVK